MESSDASWKATLEDPTFSIVRCVECDRAIISRATAEYRCGKHENEYQAWLNSQLPEVWYE